MSTLTETPGGGATLLQFPGLATDPRLVHAFTTKPWNMASHRGIGREQAVVHRKSVCALLGVPFEKLTSPQQVHGAELLCVDEGDIGSGRYARAGAVPFVDGLLTDHLGVPLILLSADCPLVLVFDPGRPALGIAHASWLGTVAGITARLIEQMQLSFGCDPGQCRAAIAPSAGPTAYEVGREVYRIFHTRFADADRFFTPRGDRFMLDLWAANTAQLRAGGVPEDRIECAGCCTITDTRFWSHRRDGADAGRNALIAALR